MARWKGAEAHKRGGHRNACDRLQFAQSFTRFRSRIDDTATCVKDRSAGFLHQRQSLFDCLCIWVRLRFVRRFVDSIFALICPGRKLNILWDIDHNGSRTPGRGDQKRLVNSSR